AQKKTFAIVKAGANIMDVLSTPDVFYFPEFTSGKVLHRDRTTAEGKLNYNRLVDEMHFINSKGDTLALADEMNIEYVAIGKDTFYYDGGYLRVLSSGNLAKLAMKDIWIISETRQVGAYNTTNTSVSITSFKSYTEGGRLYDLTVNEDVVLKKAEQHYFGDANNHFVLAGKKELLMLFPKEQRRIEMYLKENKINFTKKDDLEKIVQFLDHP
ncbi:MAG: hypothetical protein JWQ09_3950, partial [Segetibacter sp.]|nr:hypothetical protein [Segetibacter sp.]